jgi:lipoprotein-anchoring transpeptidase ErfK/SrfK
VPDAGLGPGDQGDQVRALEQRLDALHFYVGQVDDVFDDDTAYGVTAFQKVNDLPRTGRATPDVAERLASAQPPPALVPAGGPGRVEIDLNRQVLSLYEGDQLSKVLSVSTGSGERYCSRDGCGTAVTPPGSYRVDYHADGWVTSPLGRLYNPVYFDPKRGLAIHGFQEVPSDPESHGCVRIAMSAAEWFPDKAPKGTPVYVSDGQTPLQPI